MDQFEVENPTIMPPGTAFPANLKFEEPGKADMKRKKIQKPRKTWRINPVERPHSTPKGKKGYDRARERFDWKRELEEELQEEKEEEEEEEEKPDHETS